MMFLKFVIASMGGLAGHQSRRFTRNMDSGWRNLIEHAIGGAMLLPFLLLFMEREDRDTVEKTALAYTAALFSVGAGVALGWVIDSLSWNGKGD